MNTKATTPNRRAFLLDSMSSAIILAVPGCSASPRPSPAASSAASSSAPGQAPSGSTKALRAPAAARRVLLAFFSRAGENYFHGGRTELAVGNTEVIATMIREASGCDVFQIKAVEPYPHGYDETVRRNVREQEEKARPAIIDAPTSIDGHDTIILASPIWNVRAPRIMLTFAERYDFAGKTVHPLTTHAMSGLGHVVDEYTAACRGAKLGEALAIQGEKASASRADVDAWLHRIGLASG